MNWKWWKIKEWGIYKKKQIKKKLMSLDSCHIGNGRIVDVIAMVR